MAKSARHVLLALIGTSPLWLSILFLLYGPSHFTAKRNLLVLPKHLRGIRSPSAEDMASFWQKADLLEKDVPEATWQDSKKIQIHEKIVKVGNVEIFCREAVTLKEANPRFSVLLLHGMAFSSKTWLELNTLHLLAAMGIKTIAADIPGYGASPSGTIPDDFVHLLVTELGLVRPVVVSPSMSGYYTLPYLVRHWKEMGGYIPVAPQGWEVLERETSCSQGDRVNPTPNTSNVPETLKKELPSTIPDLSCIKVPTLVVWGEHDRRRNSALLCLLPWSRGVEIPDGKHPAYLSNPALWHKLVFNFLNHLNDFIQATTIKSDI